MPLGPISSPAGIVGRYSLHDKIASGGMASVHFGCVVGAAGFSKIVAVKRMLPLHMKDPEFVAMFLDEARLASRIQHPNVVATLDVVAEHDEILIVMEYIRGQSLAALLTAAARSREELPLPIATAVMSQVLSGLHAAHEARDRRGEPLGLVHRDVSPHNILVGADGVTRIMDFGIAKAKKQLHVTQGGSIKGKLSYMAPEQIVPREDRGIDRRADVYAASVVLWSMIAGQRLFRGEDVTQTVDDILHGEIPPLASFRPEVPPPLQAAIEKALARDREDRYETALDFQAALEETSTPAAPARAVGEWVRRLAADVLRERDAYAAEIEHSESSLDLAPSSSSRRLAPPDLDGPTELYERSPATPAPAGGDLVQLQERTATGDLSSSLPSSLPHPPVSQPVAPQSVLRWAVPVAAASAILTAAIVSLGLRVVSPPPATAVTETTTPAPPPPPPVATPASALPPAPEPSTAPPPAATASATASASVPPIRPAKRPPAARPPPTSAPAPCLPTDFNYPHCTKRR